MESEVLRLKDENTDLRKKYHETADALKRMTVRFTMVERTMAKADDGNAMQQLLKAETRVKELEMENEALRKKNRVLLDKLRIAEETIRFKGKLQGKDVNTINAQMSGSTSNKPGRGSLGVPPSFAAAAAGTTAHNLQAPATPGSTRARSMSAGGNAGRSSSASRSPSASSRRGSFSGANASERKAAESPATSPTYGGDSSGIALSRPPAGRPSTAGGVSPAELALKEAEIAKRNAEVASLKEQLALLQKNLMAAQSERDAAKEQARAAVTSMATTQAAHSASNNINSGNTAIVPAGSNTAIMTSSASGYGSVGAVSIPHADLLELERQLRDKTAHATLLKARYEHLEAKAAAERSLYDRAVTALEEQNAELRRTRSALQATEGDLALLRSRMASAADTEEDLRRAQETIRRLEGTLTELAESPFLRADGLGGGGGGGGGSSSSFVKDALTARQRLEQLEHSDKSLRDQVSHLQATVRGNAMELSSLQRERNEATQALDRIREENDKLRVAAEAATRSNTLLRERLALYSGGAALEGVGSIPGDALSVPVEELERALTIVRRKMDRAGSGIDSDASSLGSTLALAQTNPGDADGTPAALRKRVQQLQLALLTAQGEIDRNERLVKAQTAIAKDLSAEVSDLHARLGTESASLKKLLSETTALAEERLQRNHMLEAEVQQLLEQAKRWRATRVHQQKKDQQQQAATRRAAAAAAAAGGNDDGDHQQSNSDDNESVISALSDDANGSAAAGRGRRNHAGGAGGDALNPLEGPDRTMAPGALASSSAVEDDEDDADADGASSVTASEVYEVSRPGENRLEVYLRNATLDPSAFGSGSAGTMRSYGGTGLAVAPTTFALLDFLHFESQSTPLATGTAPDFRFSAVYPISLDAFTLRHMASELVAVEIHAARGADFELIGRAAIPLHSLLGGATKVKLPQVPVRSAKGDGRVIGSVNVELRVAVGLAAAWQAFARDRPTEAATLLALIKKREERGGAFGSVDATGSVAAITEAAARAASSATIHSNTAPPHGTGQPNDLIVTVVSATGLRARELQRGGRLFASAAPPSSYVQFTLPIPGARTCFTPVVPSAYDPVFADSRAIPIVPTTANLRALAASPLHFIVCDDAVALDHGHSLGAPAPPAMRGSASSSSGNASVPRAVLGVAAVSLAGIAEGVDCEGTFDINDEKGVKVGSLTARLMWSRPLVSIDGAPPDTLTRAQFHALAAVADREGSGVRFATMIKILTASDGDASALSRCREAIAAHMRDSRVMTALSSSSSSSAAALRGREASLAITAPGATGRYWVHALQAASAVAGRPLGRLTPREVFECLTSPSVLGSGNAAAGPGGAVQLDLPTVEDAILCLLDENESSCPLETVIDALYPLTATANVAFIKARRFFTGPGGPMAQAQAFSGGAGSGGNGFEAAREAVMRKARSFLGAHLRGNNNADSSNSNIAPVPERIPRSAFAALLGHLGMVMVEDDAAIARALAATSHASAALQSRQASHAHAAATAAAAAPQADGEILSPAAHMSQSAYLPPAFVQQPVAVHGSAMPAAATAGGSSSSSSSAAATAAAAASANAAAAATGKPRSFNASEFAFDLLLAADRIQLRSTVAAGTGAPATSSAPAVNAAPVSAPAPAPAPAVAAAAAASAPAAEPKPKPAAAGPLADAPVPSTLPAVVSPVSPPAAATGAQPQQQQQQNLPLALISKAVSFAVQPRLGSSAASSAASPGLPFNAKGCLRVEVAGLQRIGLPLATLLGAHARACASAAAGALQPPLRPDLSPSELPSPRVYLSFAVPAIPVAAADGKSSTAAAALAAVKALMSGDASASASLLHPRRIVLCAPVVSKKGPAKSLLSFSPYAHPWEEVAGVKSAGVLHGTATAFPLSEAALSDNKLASSSANAAAVRLLASFLSKALASGAEPELSDIVFTLSLLPPPPVLVSAPAGLAAPASTALPTSIDVVQAAESAYKSSILGASFFNLNDLLEADDDAAEADDNVELKGAAPRVQELAMDLHPTNFKAIAERYAAVIESLANGAPAAGWLPSAAEVVAQSNGSAAGVVADLHVAVTGLGALEAL